MTSLIDTRMDEVYRALGKLFPVAAVHHGWNAADLQVDVTERGERWQVTLIGPCEAWIEEMTYTGGPVQQTLLVNTGSHGTLAAGTSDDLIRLVKEWLLAVGVEP